MSGSRSLWGAGLALVLFARSALAQHEEIGAEAAAQRFQEGLVAFDAGDAALAVQIWEGLLTTASTDRGWRIHYNLGLAYQAMGNRPMAIENFEKFSRRVGEEPGSLPIAFEERRQDAVERAASLRPYVALLRVNAPSDGEAINVALAGAGYRPAGFAKYLEPGQITVVMGQGERAVREQLTLQPGELRNITARQLPAPPPPSPPSPPPYEPPVPNALLVVLGAASALSLALPIGLYVRAADLQEESDQVPRFDPSYPARLSAYEDARTAYQAGYALPAGLASVALALLVVNVVDGATTSRAAPVAGIDVQGGGAFFGLGVTL